MNFVKIWISNVNKNNWANVSLIFWTLIITIICKDPRITFSCFLLSEKGFIKNNIKTFTIYNLKV